MTVPTRVLLRWSLLTSCTSPPPAVESIPRLIDQVHFNGLKTIYSKHLVLFRGLELLDRDLNPWRVIGLVQHLSPPT
jgi:hypothetical protein